MFKYLFIALIAGGIYWFGVRPACGREGAVACPAAELEEGVGVTLDRAKVCPRSGYLCHGRGQRFQVLRYSLEHGKLRIRVTLPEFASAEVQEQIREAVIEGIMTWDGRPFPLAVDASKLPLSIPDVSVVWTESLGGPRKAGVAWSDWREDGKGIEFKSLGLSVMVPEDASRPTSGQLRSDLRRQIVGVAAHEMGHTLGLLHSDSRSDLMYPEFDASNPMSRPSARDLRTVDALYALPNGAMVR